MGEKKKEETPHLPRRGRGEVADEHDDAKRRSGEKGSSVSRGEEKKEKAHYLVRLKRKGSSSSELTNF